MTSLDNVADPTPVTTGGIAGTPLRKRAAWALAVIAASAFLLICLMSYGTGGFEEAVDAGWRQLVASWFLEVFGAGAYWLVILPLAWATIVYFQERTPLLRVRAVATLVLAISTGMIAGLLQGGEQDIWAGAVGAGTVALVHGLSSFLPAAVAQAMAWTFSIWLFAVSLIVATDWLFHTLRRGGDAAPAYPPSGYTAAGFRTPPPPAVDQQFVSDARLAEKAAEKLGLRPKTSPRVETPAAESARSSAIGASGFRGVQFMASRTALAEPEQVDVFVATPGFVDDDVTELTTEAEATEPAAGANEAELVFADEVSGTVGETPAPQPEPEPIVAVAETGESVLMDEFVMFGSGPYASEEAVEEEVTVSEDDFETGTAWPARTDPAPDAPSEAPTGPIDAPESPGPAEEPAAAAGTQLLFDDEVFPVTAPEEPAPEETAAAPRTGGDAGNETAAALSALLAMDLDPLFPAAVDILLARGRASAMPLQRQLGVGHPRALRLLEQMHAAGLVGTDDAGSRPLLITRDLWDAYVAS